MLEKNAAAAGMTPQEYYRHMSATPWEEQEQIVDEAISGVQTRTFERSLTRPRDAQGRFVFENLETGGAFTYVVGIRSEGQLYRSDAIALEAGERRTGVVVEVGQAMAQPPGTGETQPPMAVTSWMSSP